MTQVRPESLGELYVLEALRATGGRSIAKTALVREALSLWEAERGRASRNAVLGGLERLLSRGDVISEEHPIELGSAAYIRLRSD
jgi:hypothetical protein